MGLESLDFGAGDAHHTLPHSGQNVHVGDFDALVGATDFSVGLPG